jgi:mycothiol synthase
MTLIRRAYAGQHDWRSIAELINADPLFHHPVDFPWRLCSTSLEDHRNGAVWEDEAGHIQAFAALQFPWLTADYTIRPEVRTREMEAEIIGWTETRLHQIAEETNDDFPFNISALEHEHERIQFLEQHGYTRWEHSLVVMERSFAKLPDATVPAGFTIRPLDGERELEAYTVLQRAAFDSKTMTMEWRRRTLEAPLYNPKLDLVAAAPDGKLVGFCILWYQPSLKIAQIEPLGVHPDFQQLGLSRALIAEGFRRAMAQGAQKAMVETYSFSEPALAAYKAIGFEVISDMLKYYKEYAPPAARCVSVRRCECIT